MCLFTGVYFLQMWLSSSVIEALKTHQETADNYTNPSNPQNK